MDDARHALVEMGDVGAPAGAMAALERHGGMGDRAVGGPERRFQGDQPVLAPVLGGSFGFEHRTALVNFAES
jgi:hypothetical protein